VTRNSRRLIALIASAVLLASCSTKLDKNTAEKDIRGWSWFKRGKMTCSVRFSQQSDKKWTYTSADESCVRSLAKAGLARYDYKDEIHATETSWFDKSNLAFDCASVKFLEVTSITTEGNKASARYKRDVVHYEQLLATISDCKVDKPDNGVAERQTHFTRDDAGKWTSDWPEAVVAER